MAIKVSPTVRRHTLALTLMSSAAAIALAAAFPAHAGNDQLPEEIEAANAAPPAPPPAPAPTAVEQAVEQLAGPPPMPTPDIRFEFGAGFANLDAPDVTGFATVFADGGDFVGQSDPDWGIGGFGPSFRGQVSIGVSDRMPTMQQGTRLNISGVGQMFDNSDEAILTTGDGEGLDVLALSGGSLLTNLGDNGEQLTRQVDSDHNAYMLSVTLESPLSQSRIPADATVEFGMAGMWSETEVDAHYRNTETSATYTLEENANAWYIGPVLGVNLERPLGDRGFRGIGGARVFGFLSDADLDGAQRTSAGPSDVISLEDNNAFGARLDGQVGVLYGDGRGGSLGLVFNGGWQNQIPHIRNPRIGAGQNVADAPAARLARDDQVSWGVEVTARVTMGRIGELLSGFGQ